MIEFISWSEYFFEMADLVSSKSKDPSTKIGAVIVGDDNEILSTGFNGFPRGVDETIPERWERPIKYKYVAHGEANAIFNAARNGVALKGSIMYVNFSEVCPCTGCTRGIIQSGIKRVVLGGQPFPGKGDHWQEDIKIARIMLDEAGIEIVEETGICTLCSKNESIGFYTGCMCKDHGKQNEWDCDGEGNLTR